MLDICFKCGKLIHIKTGGTLKAIALIILQQSQSTSFCIRCGTSKGVISHWFRTETYRDMATFARAIVQGCHIAVTQQREFCFRCTYQVRNEPVISFISFN